MNPYTTEFGDVNGDNKIDTIKEILDIAQRLKAAKMLKSGANYMDISKATGMSTATISRVNRCLQYGAEGYQTILPRMEAFWEEEKSKE